MVPRRGREADPVKKEREREKNTFVFFLNLSEEKKGGQQKKSEKKQGGGLKLLLFLFPSDFVL